MEHFYTLTQSDKDNNKVNLVTKQLSKPASINRQNSRSLNQHKSWLKEEILQGQEKEKKKQENLPARKLILSYYSVSGNTLILDFYPDFR